MRPDDCLGEDCDEVKERCRLEARIAELTECLGHATEVIAVHLTRGHPANCVCGMCLCVCDLKSAAKKRRNGA